MGSSICRMDGVIFALISWLCVSGAAGYNKTNEGEDDREGKANIGIFSVVKFPNDVRAGTNNLNGTCYTASECTTKGGTAAGTCASSFGVCCTFSLACGGTSKENNTYAIINSYSTTSDADPCIYTICPTTTDICKLRIDMETMQIAPPHRVRQLAHHRGCLTQTAQHHGRCLLDGYNDCFEPRKTGPARDLRLQHRSTYVCPRLIFL